MIVVLDLETTGLDNKKDKIIEVALIKFNESTFEIFDTFSTLINPQIPIPEINSNITNIFDKDVEKSPVFDNLMIEKINNFIGDCPILGHNTYFDRDFLKIAGVSIEKNIVLDTFVLANIVLFEEKSLNLGSICESLKIELIDAHRALDDTKATLKVFEILVNKFKKLDKQKQDLIKFIFSRSEDDSFQIYLKLFNYEKDNINEENFIKKILKIIGKYTDKDNAEIKPEIKEINDLDIEEIFKNLPNSELRQNQLIMSKTVNNLLKNNKKVIIEAPTGVGKTLAYLIPAVLYSIKTKEQVIISTNTKALQDQIFYKDLNFLENNLDYDFSYTKLKGRKNYFSVSRFLTTFFDIGKLNLEETTFFSKICLWLFSTEFGELDELNYYSKEYSILRDINADHFLVLLDTNEYKYYEHIFKSRSKSQKSDIVIINHSLLLQDINSANPLFGQIKNLVIDEAHNLEDSVTDALKKSFSINGLKDSFDKILNILRKNNFIIDNIDNNIDKKILNIFSLVNLVFDFFTQYSQKKNTYGNDMFEVLIEDDFFIENKEIFNLSTNIEILLIEVFNILSITTDKTYNSLKTEISNLEDFLAIIKICLDKNSFKIYIPIFSYNKNLNHSLSYTLLNTGNFLINNLWDKIDSLLLTSATLQVNDSFNYIKNILSLNEDFDFLTLESDFDYSRQALLFMPNDLGSIKYNNPKINSFLLDFLSIVGGNSLVLFTSFSAIRDSYLNLNISLKNKKINILAQSIGGSKHKIANHFKKYSNNSVIFGTDSFWEGIDIPGEDLKYLIMHKFPFEVPSDPIFKARSKLFSDSFRDYSIPKSIIKTRQGFGRLIRTKTDKGIIVLLDDRVYSTSWGEIMKSSFPKNINTKTGNSADFLGLIKASVSNTN